MPLWVVGDRGYSSDAFRELVWASGARPAIPTRSNEAAVACPDFIYNNRNLVERLWGRLKEWRAVATRYEKTAASYLGVLCLAATCRLAQALTGPRSRRLREERPILRQAEAERFGRLRHCRGGPSLAVSMGLPDATRSVPRH